MGTMDLTQRPQTDPTALLRYRDGIYAADFLACGIVHLDLFSCKGALPLRQLEVAARRRHLRSSGVPWSSSARLSITRQQYVLGSKDSWQ